MPNKKFVLNEISKYLFGKSNFSSGNKNERNFDINIDYEHYYVDFLKYNIDLNTEDIDWWKFDKILNAILIDESSNISKIIAFRTYEKPSKNSKVREEKEHKYRMSMKRKYALPSSQNTENGFEKMWNYVEKKAGENKE